MRPPRAALLVAIGSAVVLVALLGSATLREVSGRDEERVTAADGAFGVPVPAGWRVVQRTPSRLTLERPGDEYAVIQIDGKPTDPAVAVVDVPDHQPAFAVVVDGTQNVVVTGYETVRGEQLARWFTFFRHGGRDWTAKLLIRPTGSPTTAVQAFRDVLTGWRWAPN